MSLFKQTRKTLLSVVPNKQKKSSPSSTSIQQNFSAPVVTNTKKRKAKKKEAQKTIAGSPELAKGYFALAQLYREQDDFHTATNIYLQGLESVPSDDPDYTLLLKEKEKVRTKIKQRSEDGFYHLLPYDILCLIFDDLEYKDLLQCTTVCQRWNNFMVEWPEFWNRVLLGMPNVDRSTLVSFIQGRARELRLNGSLDRGVNQDILWLLYCMENNNFIQKLCFTKSLAGSDIHQLVRIVRHMSSSLQQIELNDCSTTHNDIVKYLLPACSPGLSYLSFSRKEVRGPKNDYGRRHVVAVHYTFRLCRAPEKIHKSLEPNNINYTTLTYLKLDSHFAPLKSHNSKSSDMPAMILIKQCPNLIHLFLPACDKYSYISDCLLQAIRSCPQLITLVISVNADMPQTIVSNIDESEYHITSTTTPADTTKSALLLPSSNDKLVSSSTTIPEKKNNLWNRTSAIGKSTTPSTSCLRRFVFVQYYRDIKPDVFLQVFRASHASLELLYLSYDDCSLGADALNKLASLGCPKLREFRLSTGDNSPILGLRISTISMSTVLVRLFSACPNLEAIELDDSRWDTVRLLQISRHVVETIATKCLRLRHLHIFDSRNPLFLADRSPKAYLSFINNNKENGSRKNNGDSYQIMGEEGHGVKQNTARLESLKLTELDHETAYSLVKNLASLKHLHLKWWMENGETDNRYLEEEMKKILLRREGSLIIGDQANK